MYCYLLPGFTKCFHIHHLHWKQLGCVMRWKGHVHTDSEVNISISCAICLIMHWYVNVTNRAIPSGAAAQDSTPLAAPYINIKYEILLVYREYTSLECSRIMWDSVLYSSSYAFMLNSDLYYRNYLYCCHCSLLIHLKYLELWKRYV